jgi:hypothetical protein
VILLLIASVDPTTEADMNNLHFNYIVLHVSRLCISVFIVILNKEVNFFKSLVK